MSGIWLALIPALSGIIGAVGTIIIARWQHQGQQQQHQNQQQIFLTQKIDEIVDERVAEIRADRDEVKQQLRRADKERQRLFDEQMGLKESNAILKAKMNEIQLHREQAINRMRAEVAEYNKKNTLLMAKNIELEAQLALLRQENERLKHDFAELPCQSGTEPHAVVENDEL